MLIEITTSTLKLSLKAKANDRTDTQPTTFFNKIFRKASFMTEKL